MNGLHDQHGHDQEDRSAGDAAGNEEIEGLVAGGGELAGKLGIAKEAGKATAEEQTDKNDKKRLFGRK